MGAPLPPISSVLRIFLEGFVDGLATYKWGNVLHSEYSGTAPSNAVAAAIASEVQTQWAAHMAAEQPSPTTLNTVTVTDLTSDSAGEGEWTGSSSGTRGDDSIPANACVLISYPAATRYKGGHPRTYLYCLGNADLDGAALWSSAATAEVQTHWQAFLNALIGYTTGGTTLSNFGFVRYRGKFLPNSGPPHYYLTTPFYTPIVVANAVAKQEMASQRRRVGRRKA